jgi:hypothetical protein
LVVRRAYAQELNRERTVTSLMDANLAG